MDATENLTDTLDQTLNRSISSVAIKTLELNLNFVDGDLFGDILLCEFGHPAILAASITQCLTDHGEIVAETVATERPSPEKTKGLLLDIPLV